MEYIRNKEWPPERATKAYDEGYFAEAIQTLHGWIESQCREMLKLVGAVHFDVELRESWDVTDEISLTNVVRTLFILGQVTRDEFESLQELNTMRNRIIHQMFKDPYEKEFKGVCKKEYDKVFAKSLENSKLLESKLVKLVG